MSDDLSFHVLGRVRVERNGAEVPLAGAQRRALLALLVVNLNRVVGMPSIAAALWPEREPVSAAGSTHVAVSRLRAALVPDDPDAASALVAWTGAGYRLVAEPNRSDLARFTRARDEGLRALATGRSQEAVTHLREALAEWSGHALEGVGDLGLDQVATALEEERLDALEARLDADLRLGRQTAVVSELAALVRDVPLRESAWAKYLLALYRCGRQAEALEAYARLRAMMREELGIEPDAAVVALHGRILRHDPALDVEVAQPAQPATAATERGELDLPPARLVGPDGRVYPVHDTLTLGRLSSSTVQVDDPLVSRSHAAIRATAGGYVLADLQSTNGTYVDGTLLLEPLRLSGGETIRIASADFVFQQSADQANGRTE
jgi:DNA-binding SARP family transcriptional activator